MKLQPHQESVLAKGDRPFALHGTGTGKTLTSLKFIERSMQDHPDKPVVLVTSSALKDNLSKEKDKHGIDIDMSKVLTVTHEGMSRPNISKAVRDTLKSGGTLVLDEIHKMRNPDSKGYLNTLEASKTANKVLGLTGTAIVNNVDDLSNLYNLVQGNRDSNVSPFLTERDENLSLIDRIRGVKPKVKYEISDASGLKDMFTSLDIYYPPKNHPSMPLVTSRIEEVEMPRDQILGYTTAEDQAIRGRSDIATLARKIRSGQKLTATEEARSNAFASQTSQAAISSAKHMPGKPVSSGKLDKAVTDLIKHREDNPLHRGVIYSNKIGAGLEPLVQRLSERGLGDYIQVVQGSTNKSDVKGIVENYNSGAKPILVISDSGAEGLDLKGTRTIQVLNPHFNDGKIKQAVGRGARLGSHLHLPKEDRQVDVVHYHSVLPKKYFGILGSRDRTIDQSMHEMTETKASKRDAVISVLQ